MNAAPVTLLIITPVVCAVAGFYIGAAWQQSKSDIEWLKQVRLFVRLAESRCEEASK